MNTDDHMKQVELIDAMTKEVVVDYEYDGPSEWVEEDKLACAIRWDDMWLVPTEITQMMRYMSSLPEVTLRGAKWQEMKIVWRDDIQHYVMEVPLYPITEKKEKAP